MLEKEADRATVLAVYDLAREAGVHPAVITGRVRHERGNYRLLSQLVGSLRPARVVRRRETDSSGRPTFSRPKSLKPEGSMSNIWQVQEARARFSELLEASLAEGPQIVTKRGKEAAVLVPIEQWRKLEKLAKPSLKEFLLAPEPRTEALTPPRRKLRLRPAPNLT